MAEFTILPVSAGDSMEKGMWDELRDAMSNRVSLLGDWGEGGLPSAPAEIDAGDPPSLIAAYRAVIDALAPFFYKESTIAAGSPAQYVDGDDLHTDALGHADWDPAGGDDLTPPCPPHKALWNDMKLCLDKLKWLKIVGATFGGTQNEYTGASVVLANGALDWDDLRDEAFADVGANNHVLYANAVGRYGNGYYDPAGDPIFKWRAEIYTRDDAEDTFVTPDISGLSPMPSVTDGYLDVDYLGEIGGAGEPPYYSDLNVDIYIEGTKISASSVAIDSSDATGSKYIHLEDADLATINLDGNNNDIAFVDADAADRTIDIGDPPWEAPTDIQASTWYQMVQPTAYDIYLEFSWD